jgi:hemoglobin
MKNATLFERLGGDAAINAVVDEFYGRVLCDNDLKKFFSHIDIGTQATHQKNFLKSLTSGTEYKGRGLYLAHSDLIDYLGLNQEHFNAVIGHLVNTLIHFNVPNELIGEIASVVPSLRQGVFGYSPGHQQSKAGNKSKPVKEKKKGKCPFGFSSNKEQKSVELDSSNLNENEKVEKPAVFAENTLCATSTYNALIERDLKFILRLIASYATTSKVTSCACNSLIFRLDRQSKNTFAFKAIEVIGSENSVVWEESLEIVAPAMSDRMMFLLEKMPEREGWSMLTRIN